MEPVREDSERIYIIAGEQGKKSKNNRGDVKKRCHAVNQNRKRGVDYIIRATGANHQVRIFAATTRETVEYARQIHHTSPVATAALGTPFDSGGYHGKYAERGRMI